LLLSLQFLPWSLLFGSFKDRNSLYSTTICWNTRNYVVLKSRWQ
jgi:hypothetical protein